MAVVVGLIMPRILPYIYPFVFYPILVIIFQGNTTSASDDFNSFMMAAITFLTSFVIAFLFFRKA